MSSEINNGQVAGIGSLASAPASGTVAIESIGNTEFPKFHLRFTLTLARMSVTDAAGSGSYGALNLFTFRQGAIAFDGCRQDYTAFAEDSNLTANQGDASFDIGIGSVAIASAADGALAGTNDDIGVEVNMTASSGTATGTGVSGPIAVNGTTTAALIALNWSGTAATIEANGTFDTTATIEVSGTFLGDD